MTITAQTPRSGPYDGDGSTVAFSYNFLIDADSELVVSVLNAVGDTVTEKTLTTDYTVSGVGNVSGGTVTFVTAPASGEKIAITRAVPTTQEVDLQNRGVVSPEVLEEALDDLTRVVQDIEERVSRAVTVNVFDTSTIDQLLIDIENLADIEAAISTVSGIASSVTDVAAIDSDVSVVAANVADVTNFADVYYGPSATDPATRQDGSTLTAPTIQDGLTVDTEAADWTGTANLDPANGLVQEITLTGNVTLTDNLADGESIVLHIDDGSARLITWPTITWVSSNGTQPDLQTTADTIISIWKVGSTLYGFAANGA